MCRFIRYRKIMSVSSVTMFALGKELDKDPVRCITDS